MGEPFPGAQDFVKKVSAYGTPLLLTSRLSSAPGEPGDIRARIQIIQSWLRAHNFPEVAIWTGLGKPRALGYIDDRGISCRPHVLGPEAAYASALSALRVITQQ